MGTTTEDRTVRRARAGSPAKRAPAPLPEPPEQPGAPAAGSDAVIAVAGLRMRYGTREVVHGVDLEVRRGEIFALLGPNGAGKTTTVEILEGYRRRTAGTVRVLGADPGLAGRDWRARVGVVLQACVPEDELTVAETLDLYAGFYDRPLPVAEVLRLVGLTGQADVRNARLSGGQQRRLDFGLALIGDPELIFLDEPTTGFDPAARRAAWEVIDGLRRLGKTVVLTTHYLDEAEALADRIAVMAAGRIVAAGTPATLADRHRAPTELRFELDRPVGRRGLPPELARRIRLDGASLSLSTRTPVRHLHTVCGWLLDHGLETAAVTVRQPTLEDTYLRLTEGER